MDKDLAPRTSYFARYFSSPDKLRYHSGFGRLDQAALSLMDVYTMRRAMNSSRFPCFSRVNGTVTLPPTRQRLCKRIPPRVSSRRAQQPSGISLRGRPLYQSIMNYELWRELFWCLCGRWICGSHLVICIVNPKPLGRNRLSRDHLALVREVNPRDNII
jgi:hypothetical protein